MCRNAPPKSPSLTDYTQLSQQWGSGHSRERLEAILLTPARPKRALSGVAGTFPQIGRLPCGAYSCDVELALLIMPLPSLGAAQKPFRHPCAMVQGSGLPACRQLGCHSRSECARSKATSIYFRSLSVSMLRLHSPSSAARGDEPSRRKISRSGRPSFRAGGFCHFCSTTRKYKVRACPHPRFSTWQTA